VLDLDNTLWGGVVGDDGPGGLQLGDDYPGNTYKWFQRAVLGLRDRGILLAVCSTNDAEVVHDVLDSHPEMILRRGDFAAERVNWRPKSENLREIAEELNIGVDSLVLFDDNPVERAEVRSRLPEVRVVDVPSDPALYVLALGDVVEFDMPTVTPEDRSRTESYRAERERRQSETSATSLEEFLASLDMSAEIGPLNPGTLQRVAQLVAKTNQYNLTTRRHSEAELDGMARTDGGGVYWVRLKDRYGDMGLIGVGILLPAGADALVDSLVLSCRAANRGIEQALLAFLARTARALGYTGLVAEYLATARNHVVADLYPRLGFEPLAVKPDAARYRLDLATGSIEFPPYLTVRDGA
jgi:FkbH-like protein